MRGIVYFAGLLSGCFIGPSLDRWITLDSAPPALTCAPANATQRAVLTYSGACHIEPVKPWKRT